MTFFASDPVPSGLAYGIVTVSGGRPVSFDQFIGEVSFTISRGTVESVVRGQGSAAGDGVRFQEKDLSHNGKDVRVWQISKDLAGVFNAATVSSF
jgi:hypothetical protein